MGFDPVTYAAAVAKSKGIVQAAQLSKYDCGGVCKYSELSSKEASSTADITYYRLSEPYTSGSVTYPTGSAFLYKGAGVWLCIEVAQVLDDTQYYKKSETYNKTEINAKSPAFSSSEAPAGSPTAKSVTVGATTYKFAAGGGGGGTSDYDDLENKPKINDVTLTGNKTSSDLGLQAELSQAQLDAADSGITAAKVTTYDGYASQIAGKQATIDADNKLSADLISDGTTNKTVTSTEKTTWNNKASTAVATTSANGLMSSTDKTKLDSLKVVSGTHDGTNWTAITIDGTAKNIPAGGGSALQTERL